MVASTLPGQRYPYIGFAVLNRQPLAFLIECAGQGIVNLPAHSGCAVQRVQTHMSNPGVAVEFDLRTLLHCPQLYSQDGYRSRTGARFAPTA